MKIAFIRKRYTYHGGAEGFSNSMMKALADEGHEIHMYAMAWEGVPEAAHIRFCRVPAVGFNSFLRDLTFAFSAGREVRKEDYDIIQTHDKTLYQDIYRAGDGCHREWLRQRWKRTGPAGKISILFNPYHWLILSLERAVLRGRRFRKIIAISEMVKRDIIEHYRVPAEDIVVIYNPVDLTTYHPANREKYRQALRSQYAIPEKEMVLLFVGSGFERKGVRYLIEAVEMLDQPVTVLIVGKGPEEKYRKYIRRQRVIFCGPQQQIERYYAAADAFVFPTIYEPFGNVQLEALAGGLPVITTQNSGASEIIVNGKSGYVVRHPEDIAGIAGGIKNLLDRDLLNAMSVEARRVAERFTFKRYCDEILRLYSAIMEMKKTSQRSVR